MANPSIVFKGEALSSSVRKQAGDDCGHLTLQYFFLFYLSSCFYLYLVNLFAQHIEAIKP